MVTSMSTIEAGEFRMRGKEVTRLEAFSDTVFGFALTLLVVSLDVPRTFSDLATAMRGFPAFAICFLFLALIWNGHYKFCRRFGLDDGPCRFLTCLMLFVVLFYVYPLKFLFNAISITGGIFGSGHPATHMSAADFSNLMTIYGLGFSAVYFALALLYLYAWKLREQLELTEFEKSETRYQLQRLFILMAFGVLAAVVARVPTLVRWSGLTFVLISPAMMILRVIKKRRLSRVMPES